MAALLQDRAGSPAVLALAAISGRQPLRIFVMRMDWSFSNLHDATCANGLVTGLNLVVKALHKTLIALATHQVTGVRYTLKTHTYGGNGVSW